MITCRVIHQDCREGVKHIGARTVDAVITDPPYELNLLGKDWDNSGIAYDVDMWQDIYRVLKPGGHVLAFGASRTYHHLALALEKAGFEIRDCIMWIYNTGMPHGKNLTGDFKGWSTGLKPAYEPIVVARKPMVTSVQENVENHHTGAFHIDACRVVGDKWPANIIGDDDSTFRYFFCPKASAKDRDEGLEEFPLKRTGSMSATVDASMLTGSGNVRKTVRRNIHPTVKPTELMQYLCRLTVPQGALILDPFAGSGSTGKAAKLEGMNFVGFELDEEYVKIANARIAFVDRN